MQQSSKGAYLALHNLSVCKLCIVTVSKYFMDYLSIQLVCILFSCLNISAVSKCFMDYLSIQLVCILWVVWILVQYSCPLVYRSNHSIIFHRQYRLVAYRHFLEWVLQGEKLGVGNRIVLPACVIKAIRSKFPSPTGQYRGFQDVHAAFGQL